MVYDLIIIGGGPAGVAAGIYGARKKLNSALIAESFAGQSFTSAEIQNWIGVRAISGMQLAKNLEDHLRAQKGIDIFDKDLVSKIEKKNDYFLVSTQSGKSYETKTVLAASGARRRKLNVPGEKEFDGKGVAYCATCDAPVFRNQEVAVVGGGNAGLESARDLLDYASKIYLLEFTDSLRGDAVTREKVRNNPKVEIILNAKTTEITGDKMVTALKYEDLKTGEKKEIPVQGVFVEIGAIPNSEFVKDLVALNSIGEIMVDPKNQRTSLLGIWAAGDVSDILYKQNNVSVGDAIKAALDICDFLQKK